MAKILQMNFSFCPFSPLPPNLIRVPCVGDWSTTDADAVCNRLKWSSTSLSSCTVLYIGMRDWGRRSVIKSSQFFLRVFQPVLYECLCTWACVRKRLLCFSGEKICVLETTRATGKSEEVRDSSRARAGFDWLSSGLIFVSAFRGIINQSSHDYSVE